MEKPTSKNESINKTEVSKDVMHTKDTNNKISVPNNPETNQDLINKTASLKEVKAYTQNSNNKISVSKDPETTKDLINKTASLKEVKPATPKKTVKPPKIEDKPFEEFINDYFIPGLQKSIQEKGSEIYEIKLINGNRPVVGGKCWMVFCKLANERKFWLCFNKSLITSDKTILLAESNSEPSIVESFLIDEKKTTLPLLISRVLQRLNGQKWFGSN